MSLIQEHERDLINRMHEAAKAVPDPVLTKLEDQIRVESGVFERSHWKLKEKEDEILLLKSRIKNLENENNVLRMYMNNDTEAQADERLAEIQRELA